MFFLYIISGLIIFAVAGVIFQFNKRLIYQRAVQHLLAANAAGHHLQLQIFYEPDLLLRDELLILQKRIVMQGFKNAQPAHLTAEKLLEILGDKLNSNKSKPGGKN